MFIYLFIFDPDHRHASNLDLFPMKFLIAIPGHAVQVTMAFLFNISIPQHSNAAVPCSRPVVLFHADYNADQQTIDKIIAECLHFLPGIAGSYIFRLTNPDQPAPRLRNMIHQVPSQAPGGDQAAVLLDGLCTSLAMFVHKNHTVLQDVVQQMFALRGIKQDIEADPIALSDEDMDSDRRIRDEHTPRPTLPAQGRRTLLARFVAAAEAFITEFRR